MQVVRAESFEKALAALPSKIQQLCERQLELLSVNVHDSRLHVKLLKGDNAHSFRVTRRYRALFYFNERDQLIVFDIDHRKDAYR
jgi:mRNA-degrading endonuclease RelE of RelBE toxin-antitoxin system